MRMTHEGGLGTEPTDEDLVAALRRGDQDSLGLLVARWQEPLFRFVFRFLPSRDEAHDICQETFLRVMRRADGFRPGSRFSTWMYQIALNLCRDRHRRVRRWSLLVREDESLDRRPADRNEAGAAAWDPARAIERSELRAEVDRALGSLPPEQREVLVLKEYEGLKFREIAELLGCPESTVKSRLYYGLNGLRAALERRGIHGA